MSDSIREMLCLGSMSLLKPFGASVELEVLKLTGVLGLFPLHSASYGFRWHMSPSKWSDLLIRHPSCMCAGHPQPAGSSSPQQVVPPEPRCWGASGRALCIYRAEHRALHLDLSPPNAGRALPYTGAQCLGDQEGDTPPASC